MTPLDAVHRVNRNRTIFHNHCALYKTRVRRICLHHCGARISQTHDSRTAPNRRQQFRRTIAPPYEAHHALCSRWAVLKTRTYAPVYGNWLCSGVCANFSPRAWHIFLFSARLRCPPLLSKPHTLLSWSAKNTTPNGGPHLELGRLRLKTWSKSDVSIAKTTGPRYLYMYLYLLHT